MDTKETYEVVPFSQEEIASIHRYLGFQHTRINILADLSPIDYAGLKQSGWYLSTDKDDVKRAIADFVNLYSTMYKNLKNVGGKGELPSRLYRGTSNERMKATQSMHQFISTSTDKNVAKTFCKYGDAALMYLNVADDVPFLSAEEYRDENSRDESEIIVAPFSKIVVGVPTHTEDGYTHYQVDVKRQELISVASDDLTRMYGEVIDEFGQNVNDIENYVALEEKYEILYNRFERETDKEAKEYIYESMAKVLDQISTLKKRLDQFRTKLTTVLQGLCKQKEQEVDKIVEIKEQEKAERAKRAKEEIRSSMISDLVSKKNLEPQTSQTLQDNISLIYNGLVNNETTYSDIARTLGVNITESVVCSKLGNRINEIENNISYIEGTVNGVQIPDDISFEDISNISKTITPLLDGISYGNEIMNDCPDVVQMHKQQLQNEIKRNLHIKVQQIIQIAKTQKLEKQRVSIEDEKVGILGRLTGKAKLKELKLQNNILRTREVKSRVPQEQQEYSVRQMLAELYACRINEYGGTFPTEIESFYLAIKSVFKDANQKEISEEYISQMAQNQVGLSTNPRKLTCCNQKEIFRKDKNAM